MCVLRRARLSEGAHRCGEQVRPPRRAGPGDQLVSLQRRRLGPSALLVLCHATGDPLPVTSDGNLLRLHRALIRFADLPADALDVAALRGPVGHGTRGPVSMVGHGAPLVMEHHTTLSVGLAGRCPTTHLGRRAPTRDATRRYDYAVTGECQGVHACRPLASDKHRRVAARTQACTCPRRPEAPCCQPEPRWRERQRQPSHSSPPTLRRRRVQGCLRATLDAAPGRLAPFVPGRVPGRSRRGTGSTRSAAGSRTSRAARATVPRAATVAHPPSGDLERHAQGKGYTR
jgi:hypothetical protein